jgi:sugar O-acyltransferase (sialic acid O-acetyltransferase NeuD family)
MKEFLGIFCAGALGKEVYDIALRVNRAEQLWENIVFVDDVYTGEFYYNARVYGLEHFEGCKEKIEFIIANGTPNYREKIYKRLQANGFSLTNLLDTTGIMSPTSKLGKGIIMMAHTSVSSDVEIEDNVLIQSNIRVAHDIKIGAHSVLSANSSFGGHVHIGGKVFVGMGAVIKEGLDIKDDTIIGMGAVVLKDVNAGSIVVGNPACYLRENLGGRVFG